MAYQQHKMGGVYLKVGVVAAIFAPKLPKVGMVNFRALCAHFNIAMACHPPKKFCEVGMSEQDMS